MKTVDAELFQRMKDIQEGGNNKNDNFDMEITEEGALDKALNIEKNTPDGRKEKKNIYIYIYIYEVIEYGYCHESNVKIPK